MLLAALRHIIDFHTWRSLAIDGQLTQAETIRLATETVQAATGQTARPSRR